MNIVPGTRATSKGYVRMKTDTSVFDVALYEARITNIFLPWLVETIPDGAWQTLQGRLRNMIVKIFLNGKAYK